MADCKNLELAREWAEWVHGNPAVYGGTSDRARAAKVLAQDRCWIPGPGGMERFSVAEGADALAAAGVLAPDLPAPSFYAHENQDKPMWDTGNHFRADALDAPQVALSKAGNVWKMTPDEARSLALALLAAAAHAQKEETNE